MPAAGAPDPAVYTRAHNGWAEGMHVVDRFVKNTYEILSPLHLLTARSRITGFELLTADRTVRKTVFGDGPQRLEVVANGGMEPYTHQSAVGGEVVLPPFGFVVESPAFVAFHALSWGGLRYDAPVLFTIASLSGQPVQESRSLRIYHGFGDSRVNIAGRQHTVSGESILGLN